MSQVLVDAAIAVSTWLDAPFTAISKASFSTLNTPTRRPTMPNSSSTAKITLQHAEAASMRRQIGSCMCKSGVMKPSPSSGLPSFRCNTTHWCRRVAANHRAAGANGSEAIIVTMLANKRASQIQNIIRMKQSLKLAGSRLPFTALLCGSAQVTDFERQLAVAGVISFKLPAVPPPSWAHRTHRLTFSKLLLWNVSFIWKTTLIYLDTDTLVFRDVDVLRNVQTPAMVLRAKEGLNSGLMVLRANTAEEVEGASCFRAV